MFTIFVYEFTQMSSLSSDVNKSMTQHEVFEFNNKFEVYADRKGGITPQEFVTLYNLTLDWNERMPFEQVTINVIERAGINIKPYISNKSMSLESLLTVLKNVNDYYFELKGENIKYRSETGRISEATMTMLKR